MTCHIFYDPTSGRPVGGAHDHGPAVPCPVTQHLTLSTELTLGVAPDPVAALPPPVTAAPEPFVSPDDVAGTAG